MRRRDPFLIAVFIVVNIVHFYISYKVHSAYQKELKQVHSAYQKETKETYDNLKKAEVNLAACVKAVVGVDSGFDPLYHSVEEASMIEMIVYTEDTDSGEPRRFTMHGCQDKGDKK